MEKCVWKVKEEDRLCRFCKVPYCQERKKSGCKRKGTLLGTMRKMNIGDEQQFPFDTFSAVRAAAYLLRNQFSVDFLISMNDDSIQVKRIK